jgi:tripartite-type tricarboxylate transporter receptor subunit TctC
MRGAAPVLVLALLAGCGGEEVFPNRPITIVVPWAQGGGTDRTARQIAALLELDLKVPVTVDNATGGEGVTGHSKGARARPDGYTLTLMTVEINMLPWRGLTTLTYRSFAPCVLFNRDAAAIFVRTDSPIKTLRDLEEAIRRSGGTFKAGGTSRGAIWHLAFCNWLLKAGLKPSDATWLSIPGAAPSLQQLISGGLDVVCCSLPEAQSLVESGRIRSLGVMAEARHPGFPSVPTLREQGVECVVTGWRGLGLPKGTSDVVKQRVVSAIERAVTGPRFLEFMRNASFDARCELPERFERTLETSDAEFKRLLETPGLRDIGIGPIGAMFFPVVLGAGLVVVLAILALRGSLRAEGAAVSWKRGGEVALWVALFIALAPPAGFVTAAAVLLFALLWRCGTKPWMAAVVSLLVVPATFWMFAVRLGVTLPRGPLGW